MAKPRIYLLWKYGWLVCFLISSFFFSLSIWAKESAENDYHVGIDDTLEVNILQPEKLMVAATVAPDGSISIPYIGSISVQDKTLNQIEKEIQAKLADGYMKYPIVSISLRESRSRKFFVYGEVVKPGAYLLEENTTVLKAISITGGFTKYGSSSRVKILRPKKNQEGYETIKVNINQVMENNEDIPIQPGDIIIVSEGIL